MSFVEINIQRTQFKINSQHQVFLIILLGVEINIQRTQFKINSQQQQKTNTLE